MAQCRRVVLQLRSQSGGEWHRAVDEQLRSAQLQPFAHVMFGHGGCFACGIDGGQFIAECVEKRVGGEFGRVHGAYLSAFMWS